MHKINVDMRDVAFVLRMEKLVKKNWRYKEKEDANKILDTMLEIKLEVENYTGNSYDLSIIISSLV